MRWKQIKINKQGLSFIVIVLFAILPLIDSINGYLLVEKHYSIGTLYKFLLLIVLSVIVMRTRRISTNRLKCLLISLLYVTAVISFNVLLGGQIISKSFPIKLFFNIMIWLLLSQLIDNKVLTGKTFMTIFHINCILMIICILCPNMLGVGYNIYSGNIGYKGFFYSQNELSVILIILFYFCLYRVICMLSWYALLELGGISICILLTNTKSCTIACAVGFIVFIVEYLKRKPSKFKFLMVCVLSVLILLSQDFIVRQLNLLMLRQSSLSNVYNNSIFATITSGRIYYLQDAWSDLLDSPIFPLKLIVGNGFCSKYLIEMDLVDIFFYLGIIAVAAVILFFVNIFKKSQPNFKKDHTVIRKVNLLLVAAFSFMTGHVMFMATSGCYLALLFCFDTAYFLYPKEDSHAP